jgi:hypothetical protein
MCVVYSIGAVTPTLLDSTSGANRRIFAQPESHMLCLVREWRLGSDVVSHIACCVADLCHLRLNHIFVPDGETAEAAEGPSSIDQIFTA